MTRNRAIALAVFLLLAAGIAFYVSSSPAPAPAPARADDAAAATSPTARGGDRSPDEQPVAERSAASTPAATDDEHAAAGESAITLRGRCVDARGGEPIAGCLAEARIESGRGAARVEWDAGTAPVRSETGADGAFELEPGYDAWTDTVALRVSAPGYVPRVGRWQRPRPGSTIDLGDVPMMRAIRVDGVVVDVENAPVAGAGMMFVDVELQGRHELGTKTMLRAESDAAGRFRFDAPAYPAEWWIGAEYTGALVEPRSVKLDGSRPTFDLRVVVERTDPRLSITGTVVDWSNRPIEDVRVVATGEGYVGRGRSGPDGRFTVQRAGPVRDDGKPGTSLSCTDPSGLHEHVRPAAGERIAWGADGVEVVMRRRASRTVRVLDPGGRPVTRYAIFLFRGHESLRRLVDRTARGFHADGRCELGRLGAGKAAVLVVPRDPALAPSGVVPFVVDPDVPADEIAVALEPRVPVDVLVTDGADRPVAGSRVELILALAPSPPPATAPIVDVLDCDRGRGTPGHVVVAAGSTGRDGVAEIAAPTGELHVRVAGDSHVAHVQSVELFASTTRLHVVVRAAAELRGHLRSPDALAALRALSDGGDEPIAIVATPESGEPPPAAPVGDDGRYSIAGLPAGAYAIALRYWLRTGEVRSGHITLPVASIELGDGERRELPIDVDPLLPGTVHGRVVAGGEPLRDVHCFLRYRGPGKPQGLRVGTDGDGRYRGLVPAGDYGFSITYPAQPGPGWIAMVLPDEWQLAPGEVREQNFDVPLRRLRIRLLDAADAPLAGVPIKVVRSGYFLPGALATDSDGFVEVFPAPLDAFEVEATIAGERRTLGPVDLPPGQTEGEVVLRAR